MRILIIEDEQSSAERLKRLLEECDQRYEIASILASNAEVETFFKAGAEPVDLILSDIQLGDGLSFESLRHAPGSIPVIFTTAYDHYAVQAFKFNSLDYLLKPVDADELRAALEKAEATQRSTVSSTTDALADLLASIRGQAIRYRERFLIPHRADEYIIIPAAEVSHILIRDGAVRLCTTSGCCHLLSMTLDEVESQLDPMRFMRVNRQFIINASAVEKLSTYFLGKMRIHMGGYPDTEIIVGKDKVATVKKWLNS